MAARAIDLSGNLPGYVTDRDRLYSSPNRTVAVSPLGATTPGYTGEMVLDSSTNQLWVASTLANTGWVPVFKSV